MKLSSLLPIILTVALTGCSSLPHSGPSYSSIQKLDQQDATLEQIYNRVTIVDLNEMPKMMIGKSINSGNTARTNIKLDNIRNQNRQNVDYIGRGDSLKIAIMETPPAILFVGSGDSYAPKTGLAELPIVKVDSKGMISLPFVGEMKVINKTSFQVQKEIEERLSGIANRPQVIVSIIENLSSNIIIIGDGFSSKMPLTAKGERLLDAVTMLGSNMYDVKDTLIRVIRGNKVDEIPLSLVLSNPDLNLLLQQNDIITLINKPSSFISMGATGASKEVQFEATGINLSQALARIGGVRDNLADARGIFVFRYQERQTLETLKDTSSYYVDDDSDIDETTGEKVMIIKTKQLSKNELVPVVYQVDLLNPNSLFVMKNFDMQDNDIVYVATAPIVELQKFLYAIFSPSIGIINQVNNL